MQTEQFFKIKGINIHRNYFELDFNESFEEDPKKIIANTYPKAHLFIINKVVGCSVVSTSTTDYSVFKEEVKRKRIRSVFLYVKQTQIYNDFEISIIVNI